MVEAVVVGAGLAGLACARHLTAAGVETVVLEAGDAVGGPVRTDVVDGMLLDRGFQVHNPGYPEAQRVLDHDGLDLRQFPAGALVRLGDRLHRVGDPRRVPTWAPATTLAPIGSVKDKALIAVLSAQAALHSASEPAVRAHLPRLYGVDTSAWQHVAAYEVRDALPRQDPPMGRFPKPARLEDGLYVCGDHRDSASIQGALVSGRRAATAVLQELR